MTLTGIAYPKLAWTPTILFSLGATVLNSILDDSVGRWDYQNYGLC